MPVNVALVAVVALALSIGTAGWASAQSEPPLRQAPGWAAGPDQRGSNDSAPTTAVRTRLRALARTGVRRRNETDAHDEAVVAPLAVISLTVAGLGASCGGNGETGGTDGARSEDTRIDFEPTALGTKRETSPRHAWIQVQDPAPPAFP